MNDYTHLPDLTYAVLNLALSCSEYVQLGICPEGFPPKVEYIHG